MYSAYTGFPPRSGCCGKNLDSPRFFVHCGATESMAIKDFFALDAYRKKLLPMSLLFFAYAAAAQVSLSLPTFHGLVPIIWPPAGIGLAALFLYGYELWPAILLAALAVTYSLDASLGVSIGLAAGNTVGTLAGTYVLREFAAMDPLFAHLRDALALIWVAIFIPIISAVSSTTILWLWGIITVAEISPTLVSWWLGHMLGILVLGPFLIRWLFRPTFARTRAQTIEWAGSFLLLLTISGLIFWTPFTQFEGIPLIYLVLIPFIWIALRLGPRAMTLAVFLTALNAILGSEYGFTGHVVSANSLFLLQMFIGVLSIIFFIFVTVEEERKESTKQLEEYVIQLEQAFKKISGEDQAKNEFIAILAHELRNPLAPIVSSLEMLKLQNPSAEFASAIDAMYGHTRTIGRLLDDLLDISRISQKKFKLQKESVDFRPLILRCVQTAEAFMQSRGHKLVVSLPDRPIWIDADPVRLEQIVINLLNNSAKYTEPGGTIEFSAQEEGNELVIAVRDNGIGIEEHMLTRIFEPFTQVERGTRTAGLGIGLSLTKKLVEMHRGSIEARSPGLGQGSEFIVRLPLPKTVQLPIPLLRRRRDRKFQEQSRSKAGPLHILIVDDNEAAAQGLGKLLSFRGHEIELAYDGSQALASVERFLPDIVVLDIGLPGMDGYEVAEQLRTRYGSQIVLIALTGYGQDEDRRKAEQAGFNYHLTKPVGLSEIEAILGLAVDNKVLSV